jgi:hypothetical protein
MVGVNRMKAKKIVKKTDNGIKQNTDNFYDVECVHDSVEDDLISDAEEGFMIGYIMHW